MESNGHPCGWCLRWPECNGVAWDTPDCPVCEDKKPKQKELPAYLDDKTESGLLEEE